MENIIIGEMFIEKYSFRETCFGIARYDNKILLVSKHNQYSLVGGGLEKNETHIECLSREFLEESGYSVTLAKELVCIDCYWKANDKYPMLSKVNVYEVEVDLSSKKDASESGCYPEWVDIDKCLNLLPLPYHKKAIECYINKCEKEKKYV